MTGSTDTIELARLLRQRFIHREDRWTRQWYNVAKKEGGYIPVVEGECPNTPKCPRRSCEHITPVPLTRKDVIAHIDGKITMGLYQLGVDDTVKWLCLDVDIKKGSDAPQESVQAQTIALARKLKSLSIPFLVEDSGHRGYHLWVFFESPVLAAKAMALGHFLAEGVEPIDDIGIEVFPKQVKVKAAGNLVKLPLGIHQKTDKRCLFVDGSFQPYDDQMAKLAAVGTITAAQLDDMIEQNCMVLPDFRLPESDSSLVGDMTPPCMHAVMVQGVSEGARDIPTFRLACYFRDRGLPVELAHAALREWNDRNSPPLEDERLTAKIESAYSDSYSFFPCQEETFDRYCSSSCRYYEKKMAKRKGRR